MVRGVEVAKAALEKQGHTVSGIFFICFMFWISLTLLHQVRVIWL
jgi:hypothetical protein